MNKTLLALYCKTTSFLKREDGASAIEYGIIAGLIAAVIVAGATDIGENIQSLFEYIAGKISTPTAG